MQLEMAPASIPRSTLFQSSSLNRKAIGSSLSIWRKTLFLLNHEPFLVQSVDQVYNEPGVAKSGLPDHPMAKECQTV